MTEKKPSEKFRETAEGLIIVRRHNRRAGDPALDTTNQEQASEDTPALRKRDVRGMNRNDEG